MEDISTKLTYIANDMIVQFDKDQSLAALDDAIVLYGISLRYNPSLADNYTGLSNVNLRLCRIEAAKKVGNTYDKLTFNELYTVLQDAAVKKYFDIALESAKKALELNPNSQFAHLALGRCFSSSGNLEGAISEMEEATFLSPDFARAHYELGQLYLIKGDKKESQRHLKKATEDPQLAIFATQLLKLTI